MRGHSGKVDLGLLGGPVLVCASHFLRDELRSGHVVALEGMNEIKIAVAIY